LLLLEFDSFLLLLLALLPQSVQAVALLVFFGQLAEVDKLDLSL
jgi:hypothetical protein